jgi:hypothetical protein
MAHPPVVTVSAPTNNARFRQGQTVATSFSCTSNVNLEGCTGPSALDTTVTGAQNAIFRGTDQFGQTTSVTVPYYVDGTPPQFSSNQGPPLISNSGSATFTFAATDPDEPSYNVTFTCKLDTAAAAPCTSPKTVAVPAPIDGVHVFTVTASDRVGNLTTQSYTWTIDSSAPMFHSFIGPADPSDDQTNANFAWSADDPPNTALLTFACTLDGAPVSGCTPTGVALGTKAARTAPYVFRVTATDPAGNQSTVTHSWHVYKRTVVVADPVIPGVTRLSATLSDSVSGSAIAGQKLYFTLGRTSGGQPIPCIGGSDNSAVTNSSGVATCNISLASLTAAVGSGFTATFNGNVTSNPPYFASSDDAGLAGS